MVAYMVAVALVVSSVPAFSQVSARQDAATFCGAPASGMPPSGPKLLPRDEAATRPDFLAFRRQLQNAVARKDTAAVLRIADPDIKMDFGGGEGLEFLERSINDPSRDFWGEFGLALAMGGTFVAPDDFATPYVYSAWPDGFDSFECMAVTARAVRLREKPTTTSRVLAWLNFDIVEWIQGPETTGWERVRLASGLTGYVAATFLRSPINLRAWFARTEGGWRLKAFVAGD